MQFPGIVNIVKAKLSSIFTNILNENLFFRKMFITAVNNMLSSTVKRNMKDSVKF